MRRLWVAVTAVAALSGCAAHRPPAADPLVAALAAIDRADARLLDGCYACLMEARDGYVALLGSPLGGLAARRRFDAGLLIVLREKELTIDTGGSMRRLEVAGAAVPAGYDVPRLLKRLSSLVPQATGLPDAAYTTFIVAHQPDAVTAAADLAWLANAPLYQPVRDYLTLSVRCNPLTRIGAGVPTADQLAAPSDDPPLLAYRRATCRGEKGLPALGSLYEAHPEMAEAAYYLSINEPLKMNGPSGQKRKLTVAAYAVFPLSPSVVYAMAIVSHSAGNCREGLKYYDETLVLQDRHESAQLGRATCLTYLKRPGEAIEAATRLIEWNSTKLLEAYYWRAYNHRVQEHLDSARADIDASKRQGSTAENRTLAGVIEYEQDDLTPAVDDLNRGWALSMARGCTAAWYLGLVHIKRDSWSDAAGGFERATSCFARNVSEDKQGMAAMEALTDVDPEFRASQLEGFKAAIVEDERQQRAAALNTATCYARGGNAARAQQFLPTAELEPSFAEQIQELKAFMDRQAEAAAPASSGAGARRPIQ